LAESFGVRVSLPSFGDVFWRVEAQAAFGLFRATGGGFVGGTMALHALIL